jgi:DNA-binding MarR family transcriptional regulator
MYWRPVVSIAKLPCYCGTLRQATRALTNLYDERLQSAGIRVTQYTILQALEIAPNARIRDLEEVLAMDQTTLTRNLALLQRRELVDVAGRPSGREKSWGLTARGKSTLAAARPLWERAQAEVRDRVGAKRARSLHDDVFDLVARLA